MKKLIMICILGSIFAKNVVPDMNKEKVSRIDQEMLTIIWKQAMEAKELYKTMNMQSREEIIDNLASTAPREEFIVNVDISEELAAGDPSAKVFLSTTNQLYWDEANASPINMPGYENTWEAVVLNNGGSNIAWYIAGEVDSEPLGFDYGRIIVSQAPYNENNTFPPLNSRYALLASDETGDASNNQDITDIKGTYSENQIFMSMGINGGCCDEGGFFGPWYLYGVAIVNPEAENAVAYAIGYGDGGFGQLVPGLYKITGDIESGEVSGFDLITENMSVSTTGNNMQAGINMDYIFNDADWGAWPNSFEGFISLGVTVEAYLDGLDIGIDLKDQTSPGLMLLSTQFQDGNTDCGLSNPIYDYDANTWSVDYIDVDGNLPWFKQLQICIDNGPCYYFADMISAEHNYLEGTTFKLALPDIITDQGGEMIPDGEYVVKMWFADGEVGEYQISENVSIINGQISDGDSPCSTIGDVNGDGNLNVLDVVLTVNNVLCLDGGDCYDLCADMNQDGILNVLDVVLLVSLVLDQPLNTELDMK